MKRTYLSYRHALIAVTIALGAGGHAFAADYVMRISHQFPPTHQTAVNLAQFEKDV